MARTGPSRQGRTQATATPAATGSPGRGRWADGKVPGIHNAWFQNHLLPAVVLLLGAGLVRAVRPLGRGRAGAGGSTRRSGSRSSPASVASESLKRSRAVSEAVEWVVVALTYFIAAILALDRLGIPLTTLVAPATVIGIGLGFGAQQMVGDLLAGFFLFAEHQFAFGDVIRLSVPGQTTGITGTVEELTLRVTKVRTAQGELVVVPNSALRQVTNLSKDWSRAVIDIPVSVTEDLERGDRPAEGGVRGHGRPTRRGADLLLGDPVVAGVETIDVGYVQLRLIARTLPGRQFEVAREIRLRAATALRSAGVSSPVDGRRGHPMSDRERGPVGGGHVDRVEPTSRRGTGPYGRGASVDAGARTVPWSASCPCRCHRRVPDPPLHVVDGGGLPRIRHPALLQPAADRRPTPPSRPPTVANGYFVPGLLPATTTTTTTLRPPLVPRTTTTTSSTTTTLGSTTTTTTTGAGIPTTTTTTAVRPTTTTRIRRPGPRPGGAPRSTTTSTTTDAVAPPTAAVTTAPAPWPSRRPGRPVRPSTSGRHLGAEGGDLVAQLLDRAGREPDLDLAHAGRR